MSARKQRLPDWSTWVFRRHKWCHRGHQREQPPASPPNLEAHQKLKQVSTNRFQEKSTQKQASHCALNKQSASLTIWPLSQTKSNKVFFKFSSINRGILDVNLWGNGSNGKLGGETPLILRQLELIGGRLRGAVAHLSKKHFISFQKYNLYKFYLGRPPYGEGL